MAEYFRDDQRQDVLLLIDNVFRFIQAGSEVSGLMGQLPSRLGYQPTLGTELAELQERICSTSAGSDGEQRSRAPGQEADRYRCAHALEATVAHVDELESLAHRQTAQGLRGHDRPGIRAVTEAACEVHSEPEEFLAFFDRLAGVDPDSDIEGRLVIIVSEAPLHRDRRIQRIGCLVK